MRVRSNPSRAAVAAVGAASSVAGLVRLPPGAPENVVFRCEGPRISTGRRWYILSREGQDWATMDAMVAASEGERVARVLGKVGVELEEADGR